MPTPDAELALLLAGSPAPSPAAAPLRLAASRVPSGAGPARSARRTGGRSGDRHEPDRGRGRRQRAARAGAAGGGAPVRAATSRSRSRARWATLRHRAPPRVVRRVRNQRTRRSRTTATASAATTGSAACPVGWRRRRFVPRAPRQARPRHPAPSVTAGTQALGGTVEGAPRSGQDPALGGTAPGDTAPGDTATRAAGDGPGCRSWWSADRRADGDPDGRAARRLGGDAVHRTRHRRRNTHRFPLGDPQRHRHPGRRCCRARRRRLALHGRRGRHRSGHRRPAPAVVRPGHRTGCGGTVRERRRRVRRDRRTARPVARQGARQRSRPSLREHEPQLRPSLGPASGPVSAPPTAPPRTARPDGHRRRPARPVPDCHGPGDRGSGSRIDGPGNDPTGW